MIECALKAAYRSPAKISFITFSLTQSAYVATVLKSVESGNLDKNLTRARFARNGQIPNLSAM